MKRIIALAVLALGVFASTAGAAISIAPALAGPGYQNLSPWTCNGRTFSQSNGPIRLGFGWFANNQGGLKQFFNNSHGSIAITGTDTFNDSWANSKNAFVTAQGIEWTTGEPNTGTTPGGQPVNGVASWYRGVLAFAPGTYNMTVSFVFDKAVNDGWDTYTDPISNGGCSFTIVP
jgi:hypothetical protein